MTGRCDVIVIGGGLVGLATARALQAADSALDIVLVEKEDRLAVHQSGCNSGVLHTGLYYRPGSLKARLCVAGRTQMLGFCEQEELPVRVTGKLVVAVSHDEVPRLEALHERGIANGLTGIERFGKMGIADHEPHASGIAALWVPGTGVVDFGEVAERLGERLRDGGASVVTGAAVDRIDLGGERVTVGSGDLEWKAKSLVNAAGLHADRVARLAGIEPPARIIPFRGEYFVLVPEADDLVRGLIYPVPDPRFPFLGVHFTRGIDGSVEVGPNAVFALGREQYRGTRAEWSGLVEALSYQGFRRLAARHFGRGFGEAIRSRSRALYVRRARRLVPDLQNRDLRIGGSGVRAQAVLPDGSLADDFLIAGEGPLLHVLNAPSPAATSALAIGEDLAARLLKRMR